MVTVKQLKENGFDILDIDMCRTFRYWGKFEYQYLNPTNYDSALVIDELAWRKNTGVMPVSADCWVDVEFASGNTDTDLACAYNWGNELLIKWKPSLKHLEQQMNKKTALEMSERDIENYADDCDVERELKESDEVIWVRGDQVSFDDRSGVYIAPVIDNKYQEYCWVEIDNEIALSVDIDMVKISSLRKPETPEQKAARERDEEIKSLMKKWGHVDCETNKGNIVYTVIEQMLDEGYRK